MTPVEAPRPILGLREEDWPTTPEGITALLKRMKEIEPLEMTDEEKADLAAWRSKQRQHELAHWEERARRIEELFE